jgi:hypothetical protein
MEQNNIGSSFDSRLREEGIDEEVTEAALGRSLRQQGARESTVPSPRREY